MDSYCETYSYYVALSVRRITGLVGEGIVGVACQWAAGKVSTPGGAYVALFAMCAASGAAIPARLAAHGPVVLVAHIAKAAMYAPPVGLMTPGPPCHTQFCRRIQRDKRISQERHHKPGAMSLAGSLSQIMIRVFFSRGT
jgi:hypothetical protein